MNDQERLAAVIQEFMDRPMTMGELTNAVAKILGLAADQANEIAVTELTRAYAMKSKAEADEVRASGFEVLDIWRTTNDELVCELCDHEGKVRGDGWNECPPVHPGCRCSVEHEAA